MPRRPVPMHQLRPLHFNSTPLLWR